MVNYQNGKIYKIESNLGNKIYIESTTKKYLSQRMDHHRSEYKQWKNKRRGFTSSFKLFEEYGLDNCKIILLELVPCNLKDELLAREAHYIKSIDCENKVIPQQTPSEYYEKNKEKMNAISRKYYEEHQEERTKYLEDTKELRKEQKKLWYEKNVEKIQCSCGGQYTSQHKKTHEKTKKHLSYVNDL